MHSHLQHLTTDLERLWIDEVRHLHNLWRRGPNRNPNPTLNPNLGPTTSAAFKRREDRKKRRANKQKQQISNPPEQPQPSNQHKGTTASDIEWLCPVTNLQEEIIGWPEVKPKPSPKPLSAEEKERLVAGKLQENALRAYQDFLKKGNLDGDGEEEDDPMEEDDDDEEEEDGTVESGTLTFFLGLFERDEELRGYYEKNWEKGEFSCLVCSGMGQKRGKRYGNCTGLVQHSNSIYKTKRKEAHRAFARAVCRVLGWDINRLPSIVLDMGKSLGQSLSKDAIPKEVLQKEGTYNPHEELLKEVPEPVGTDNGKPMDLSDTFKETSVEDGDAVPKEHLSEDVEA